MFHLGNRVKHTQEYVDVLMKSNDPKINKDTLGTARGTVTKIIPHIDAVRIKWDDFEGDTTFLAFNNTITLIND